MQKLANAAIDVRFYLFQPSHQLALICTCFQVYRYRSVTGIFGQFTPIGLRAAQIRSSWK